MSRTIILPSNVPDGELRLYWDDTEDGNDIYAWGPRPDTRMLISGICDKGYQLPEDFAKNLETLRNKAVVEKPSLLDELEARGYDKRTLVMTIRKKDYKETALADNHQFDNAVDRVHYLKNLIEQAGEVKGVYVYEETEMSDIKACVDELQLIIDELRILAEQKKS